MKYAIVNVAAVINIIPVNDFLSRQTNNGLYAYSIKAKA